jgi:hypothetical protein
LGGGDQAVGVSRCRGPRGAGDRRDVQVAVRCVVVADEQVAGVGVERHDAGQGPPEARRVRHLATFRDKHPDAFVHGVVVYPVNEASRSATG